MVLCKHFQQGTCRFGSKCHFEHIDIKQIVKNDVEGAINGNQYPFSCYGPFKDKPCVPNFIEDKSFEELRFLCYESKEKHFFDKFHQQFSIEVVDALNKMKVLLQPSYDILNMLTMIYDAPVTTNSTGTNNNTNVNSNPFGMNATTNDASSIFGKSTISNTQTGGNVFSGGGIFGGGATSNNNAMQQAGSIFGGQNTFNTQQQSSIFGQQQQQQQQQMQQGTTGSLFGSVTKPSIFGQPQTAPQTGNNFGLFGQAAQQTSSLFNQQQRFGQQQPQTTPQLMMQPQQQQQQTGLFGGGQSGFGNQAMNLSGTFGQTQQQQQPQTQNVFSQSMPQATQPQNTMPTNVFAQSQQPQLTTSTQSFFQQVPTSQPMVNMQQSQQVQPQQQQSQQMYQQQPQQMHPQQQMTVQQMAPQQTQNQIPTQPQQSPAQSDALRSIYSKMEDLTEAEISAFKADVFEPGKLPFSAPPLELVN